MNGVRRAEADDRIVNRIRKLFALSKSTNEAEATAALEKAHAMLRDYNLEMIDVAEKSEITQDVIEKGKRQKKWKHILMIGISKACYCCFIYSTAPGGYRYRIYGRAVNIETVKWMYEYLTDTIERLANNAITEYHRISRAQYSEGMVIRIIERLEAMMIEENNSCTALVPVATEAERFAEDDCHFQKISVRSSATYSTDLGYRDGDKVSLDRQLRGEPGSTRIAGAAV